MPINPSAKPKKPRWHLIYFLLAAFDIMTVGVSLTLNHQMMAIYQTSVAVNQEWADRLRNFTILNGLAQQTNAPGNDVFDTREVAAERRTRDYFLGEFVNQSQEIRSELKKNVTASESAKLLASLYKVDDAMAEMVLHADKIFGHFEDGAPELAGRIMATMDRSYGELSSAISVAVDTVQDIQVEHLNQQILMAQKLKRFEYFIGGMIVMMVLAVTIYGHKIGRAMRSFQEELEASHDRAHAIAEHLEDQNRELVSTKESLQHSSTHDFLSGLPNRRHLDNVLSCQDVDGPLSFSQIALLHIDLDKFKQVNDVHGHDAGDHVIVHTAKILMAAVRPGDFVARVGGDEFVVITRFNGDTAPACKLANELVKVLRMPIAYGDTELRIGASVGLAFQKDPATPGTTLMVQADIALYRAKNLGRNRCEQFSEELHAQILNKQQVADEVRQAVENEAFVPHYQIQVDAKTLEIVGVEALARLHHPTIGLQTPDYFLEAAEEIGLIHEIDRIILEKALTDLRAWKSEGISVPRVSVNISARRLATSGLLDLCRELQVEPGELSFELVETIFLDHPEEETVSLLEEFRNLGIDVEIDDFGTGHASILSVLSIAPNRLKIDRVIVSTLLASAAQLKLIRSIVEFGASMGIEIVAEGVETPEQARALRRLGCGVLQGFAFSKPVPSDEIRRIAVEKIWKEAS